MRLRLTLLHVAVLASTGCSSSGALSASPPDAAREAAGDDGGGEAGEPVGCGGCNCGTPAVPSGNATPDQACAMAQGTFGGTTGGGEACNAFCATMNHGASGGYFCTLPQAYVNAYQSVQADGGDGLDAGAAPDARAVTDASADAGPTCPRWSGDVVVSCGYPCLGRRTDGLADPEPCDRASPGPLLAERAYLEAVSVHAFARLERELAAHGAPPALLRDARRARRDEIRHTAMMARLARRFGVTPRMPQTPRETLVRSLFAIALENAVEGCVRETYGAVVGLVEARTSRDPDVRRAARSIAADECRHAELSWAVAEWILPRLTPCERVAIDRAVQDAIGALESEGDARIVQLLASRVWTRGPSALA